MTVFLVCELLFTRKLKSTAHKMFFFFRKITNLSMKLRNLGLVFDQNLTRKYKVAAEKEKATAGLINIAKKLKFINKETN